MTHYASRLDLRDTSARSSWGCPRALTRYAIDAANAALMGRFSA